MAEEPQQQAESIGEPVVTAVVPEDPWAFGRALIVAAVVLIALDWLLGMLLWLPFFSGLLGFFVEGLIAGGIAFRYGRRARPIGRRRLWSGIALLVVISMIGVLFFESYHFCNRVGEPPYFTRSRNLVLKSESDAASRKAALEELSSDAVSAIYAFLANEYPPGGMLGYARWATMSGTATIELRGESQSIRAEHRGWVWPTRTAIGAILLAVGLAMAFDALKDPTPVRNVLLPGEEYEEMED